MSQGTEESRPGAERILPVGPPPQPPGHAASEPRLTHPLLHAGPETQPDHIDYTNSQHRWRGVITRFNIAGRKKFYQAFMNEMAPTATASILDVGVTPDQSAADSNFFEKWYPHPECITATSIEDASHLAALHPGLTFVQTSGDGLPFEDDQFDIAFSTAGFRQFKSGCCL